jgi:hypothetical protein
MCSQGLAERGEKLQRLENKFADLADRSQGFLEAARALNQQQAEKKWYDLW